MAERRVSVRLASVDSNKLKADLRDVGRDGKESLAGITAAAAPASQALSGIGRDAEQAAVKLNAMAVRAVATAEALSRNARVQGSTATVSRIEQVTGVAANTARQRAEIEAYGQALDDLRAKYNPLFAVSRRYEQQLEEIARAEKIGAISAREAATAREAAARSLTSASSTLSASSGLMAKLGQNAQTAGFQVQDFFIQIAGGTSVMTAFSQQAPQLLGSLGVSGSLALYTSLAGTAIAVTAALVPLIFSMGEKAKSADERMKDLADSVADYVQAADRAEVSTSELVERYGRMAETARDALREMAAIKLSEAMKDLSGEVDTTQERFLSLVATSERADRVGANAASRLRTEYEMTNAEIDRVADALMAMRNAEGPRAQAEAAADLRAELSAAFGELDDMPEGVQSTYNLLTQITLQAAEVAARTDQTEQAQNDVNKRLAAAHALYASLRMEADGVAAQTERAADAALRLAQVPGANIRAGDDERGSQREGRRDAAEYLREKWWEDYRKRTRPARGGGGKSDAEKAADRAEREAERDKREMEREAQSIYEGTLTAAERLAKEEKELSALRDGGYFNALGGLKTYELALDQLRQKYDPLNDATRDFGQAALSNFRQMITEGAKLGDVLASLANKLADMAFEQAALGLFGADGSSGAAGGVVKSLLGWLGFADGGVFRGGQPVTAFAAGGVVSRPTLFPMRSGVGLMGEAGPEAIMPLSRGADGRLGVRAAGGASRAQAIEININLAGANGDAVIQQLAYQAANEGVARALQGLPGEVAAINAGNGRRR